MKRPPSMPADYAGPEEEAGWLASAGSRLAAVADDLPFIPLRPYEKRWLQLGWRAAAIVLLAAAAFWRSVGGFVWTDDTLVNELSVRTGRGMNLIWAHPLAGPFSPMARTLAWLHTHLIGPGASGFREQGIAMHAATSVFGWLVLRRLGVRAAWLAAAAYAVHPALLPNVAWVSRQGELLATMTTAIAVWAYLVGRQIRPAVDERVWTDPAYHEEDDVLPRWPWVVVALALPIALLCGSAAPVLAAAGCLAIEIHQRRLRRGGAVALLAVLVVAVAARAIVPHGGLPASTVDFAPPQTTAAEAVAALPTGLLHALAPADLCPVYDRDQWASVAWLATLTVLTLVITIAALVRRTPWTLALSAAGLYAVAHGLFVGRRAVPAVLAADLVPLGVVAIALAIAIGQSAAFLSEVAGERATRIWRWAAGAAILAGLVSLAVLRSPDFAETDAFWQYTLDLNPDSVTGRIALAASYQAEHYWDEAAVRLDRVPENRRNVAWLLARGRLHAAQGQFAEAVACYESAHRQRPDDLSTTMTLAESYDAAGRFDEAAKIYADLLDRVHNDAALYTSAGLTQVRLGHPRAAIDLYEHALKLSPDYIPAHVNLANALFAVGKIREAAEQLQRVIAIDPRNYAAFINAGVMQFQLGAPEKAEQNFRAAVHLEPQSADAYTKLGFSLAAQKKEAEAQWCFTQADRLASGAVPPR